MEIRFVRTELSRQRVKEKTGNSVYEIWKGEKLCGWLNKNPKYGWQIDVETSKGQKIRHTCYFKHAKQYAKELLA